MDNFEQRMQQAAAEVRDATKDLTPATATVRPVRKRPNVLVFAAGFAIVALAIGILPGILGDRGNGTANPNTTLAPPATVEPTTTQPEPAVECSATGVPVPSEWPAGFEAPDVVKVRWQSLVEAVAACDLDLVERNAASDFSIFFGAYGVEQFREWEANGEGELDTLLLLLGMTPAVIEYPNAPGDVPDHYVWPAAFAYDTWADVPQNLKDEVLVLYTAEEIEQYFETYDLYGGWRTAITEDGDWVFLTSGD